MYDDILLPTDGDSMASVYEHALDIAERRDATVHLLYVVDDRSFLTLDERMRDDVLAELHEDGETTLAEAAALFEERGVAVETATRRGDPVDEILGQAEALGADLLVMGSRRRNYRETMLGSVSQKVIAGADVPVLTVNVAREE